MVFPEGAFADLVVERGAILKRAGPFGRIYFNPQTNVTRTIDPRELKPEWFDRAETFLMTSQEMYAIVISSDATVVATKIESFVHLFGQEFEFLLEDLKGYALHNFQHLDDEDKCGMSSAAARWLGWCSLFPDGRSAGRSG